MDKGQQGSLKNSPFLGIDPVYSPRTPTQAEDGVVQLPRKPSITREMRQIRIPNSASVPNFNEARLRPNILAPEKENKSFFQPWIWYWTAVTCCFPSIFLERCLGMHTSAIRSAWREKVGLCSIAFVMCGCLGYITFAFQSTVCLARPGYYSKTVMDNSPAPHLVIVHGLVYDMTKILDMHSQVAYFTSNPSYNAKINSASGIDVSRYFPNAISSACSVSLVNKFTVSCSDTVNFPGIVGCHAPAKVSSYLDPIQVGNVYYSWSDVSSTQIVYNNLVIDISSYLSNLDKNISIFGTTIDSAVRRLQGADLSKTLQVLTNGDAAGDCLASLFTVGKVDIETGGCFMSEVVLIISLIIIGSLIVVRFMFALWFSWAISSKLGALDENRKSKTGTRRTDIMSGKFAFTMNDMNGELKAAKLLPTTEVNLSNGTLPGHPSSKKSHSSYGAELYIIMLVTCYSENEEEIRNTFDSLAMTDYSEDYKVLFIVADGLVKGQGNSITTPDIVLSLLELDPNWPDPTPFSYIAVASGTKQVNYAKVYVAWYNHNGRSVPTILVVKTGGASEQKASKPGNRGKRDSQIMLMKFLEHVTFNERLCPFEYDLFQKLHFLMGVTPDFFEIVLMVDADTKVAPDSVARMVACMSDDPLVMGLCGETRIGNKSQTYVYTAFILDNTNSSL